MITALYTPNTRVSFNGLPAIATPLPQNYLCLTFDTVAQAPAVLTEEQVYKYFGKNLHLMSEKTPAPLKLTFTLEEQLEIERRMAYIKRLKEVSRKGGCGGVKIRQAVIDEVSRKIGDLKKVSPAQLARWFKQDATHSQGIAATVITQSRQRRSNFPQEIIDLALQAIDQYYLIPSKPTKQFAFDCFVDDVIEQLGEDTDYPSYVTFSKWIDMMIPPMDLILARHGKKAAREAKRDAVSRFYVDRIHERAEADAVHLAVGIVDDNQNYLGTVTLFVVIDCHSRAITGIQAQIGRGESSASVIDCFRNAISVKNAEEYSDEVVNDWPMYGSPSYIATDGGSGYAAHETVAFCQDAESEVVIVETGKGWKKPFVESFFKTLRTNFAKTLPGYCGKYTDQRQLDKTVQEQACLTLAQFESALVHWIVDEYHQSPHRGLDGKTPYDVWKESAEHFPPMLPANYERIQYTKGQTEVRIIQGEQGNKGVVINNVEYNDIEGHLKAIASRLKQMGEDPQVVCEYSPNDISTINVVDPFTDEIFVAYAKDKRVHEQMSLAEFQAKYSKPKNKKGYGRSRVAKNSAVIQEAKGRHKQKMKHTPKRSSPANTDEIEGKMRRHATPNEPSVHSPDVTEEKTTTETDSKWNDGSPTRKKEFGYE